MSEVTAGNTDGSDAPEGSLDIAIVGMAGRFPKARDVQEYWSNLKSGVCSRTEFTEQELLDRGVDAATLADPNYVRAGYVLEGSDAFDARFFGYSPREAELMDPQHRLLLECAWQAMESAGYDPQRYDGLVGVYAGAGFNSYLLGDIAARLGTAEIMDDKHIGIGNRHDFLSTKVSYKLGLQGPSINIQSACSTSLVAIVQAAQGLLDYQCDMALAGGAAINQTRRLGYLYSQDGLYSPDGFCRTLDARAAGTVAGEGVGLVVLKRLDDALADGDHIHAVIKGSAVNNDGSQRAGYTAPSAVTQADVITTAMADADVTADSVRYVEVHGVATILGDPIEVSALASAYAGVPHHNCVLGSAKTNIGHLDAAAGVAGLIKAALVVEHGVIPPTLHFESPNPRIDLSDGPFTVTTELTPWPEDGRPRRAAVSSFGLGGTNAHVILEQPPRAPAPRPDGQRPGEQVLLLSAKSASALDNATERLSAHLRAHPELPLEDVAFTLQQGRQAFPYRRVLTCDGVADAIGVLDGNDDTRLLTARTPETAEHPVGFMFAGVGGQFAGMARDLYEREPVFAAAFDRCADLVEPLIGQDIRPLVFTADAASGGPGSSPAGPDRMLLQPERDDHPLDRPSLAYPAVFALEYGLVELWESWGVRPGAVIGHSLGEYVAACVAGVFTLPDALRLVVGRARLIESQGEGAMLAVPLREEEAARYTGADVCVAAVNGPGTCVLSGTLEAIERVEKSLDEDDVVYRRVPSRFAYHSAMMDPVVEPYRELVRQAALSAPTIPLVSNLTGTWITDEQATDPDYWCRHMRGTVRFADGVGTLWSVPDIALVEIGPGRTLTPDALQHPAAPDTQRVVVPSLPGAYRAGTDRASLLKAAGHLWLSGHLHPFPGVAAGRRTALPGYPFEPVTYRMGEGRATPPAPTATPVASRGEETGWFYEPSWQRRALPAGTAAPEAVTASDWLVFLDETGAGREVVARLAALGARAYTVSMGEEWRAEDDAYTLDPADPEHYARLAAALRARGDLPRRVVHCWSVGADADRPATPGEQSALLDRAFGSLARWAHACGDELMTVAQRWGVVSTEACAVLGDEPVCPPKAAVQGACVVLPQEYPLLDCVHLDLRITGPAEIPDLARRVVDTLAAPSGERSAALRGRHLWTPVYLPVEPVPAGAPTVKEAGVYLITGGLGRIGLHVARVLAESAPVRLVLVGRTGLPPRESWDDAGHPESAARGIAAVRDLEALGAEVMVAAADVSDRERMHEVKARVLREFGPVDGVVHCAGATGAAAHRAIAESAGDDIARHFAPKVRGAYVLDDVLADQPLDFALLCSSIASVIGGPGLGAYAAACAALDAFAQQGGPSGRRWTGVNWESWSFSGTRREGGGGQGPALSVQEGHRVLRRLLSGAAGPQVAVSTEDLGRRRAQWLNPAADAEPSAHRYERPNLRNPYVTPGNESERAIADIWQDLLGLESVGVHDNFFELGGSSLLGLQVVNRLRRSLSAAVPLTIVYEGPTVRTLAALVDGLKADR